MNYQTFDLFIKKLFVKNYLFKYTSEKLKY